MTRVTAVITGAGVEGLQRCRAALASQQTAVAAILTGPDSLAQAGSKAEGWVWVLHGGAAPRPDALTRLLALDHAAVRFGMVVNEANQPLAFALPTGAHESVDAAVSLAARRALPARRGTLAHTLISVEALRRHGLPDARFGPYAGEEWTSRAAVAGMGVFIPGSVAVLPGPPEGIRSLRHVVPTLRTSTWTNGEKIATLAGLFGATFGHR